MTQELKYYSKTPLQSSEEELNEFHRLVLEGGKVQAAGLFARIRKCVVLGYCVDGNNIVGVSAIKRPQKSYREKIIKNANLERVADDLEYEIGYSFTCETYRRKGISTNIKSSNLEWMDKMGGTIFSTTAVASSQNFLMTRGFAQFGSSYNGKNDSNIKYFELTLQKTSNDSGAK